MQQQGHHICRKSKAEKAEGAAATAETQTSRTAWKSTTARTAATVESLAAQEATRNGSNRKDVNNSGEAVKGILFPALNFW